MQRWQIPHSAQTIIYKHGADFASSTEVTVRGDAAEAVAKLLEQQGKSSTDAAKVGRLFGDNVLDELQFREWNGLRMCFFSFSLSLFFKCHFFEKIHILSIHVYMWWPVFYSLFSCACPNGWDFSVFFDRPMWKSAPQRWGQLLWPSCFFFGAQDMSIEKHLGV